MNDGFRSAEIGAPLALSAFTATSTCTHGCNPQDGHSDACAAQAVIYVYPVKPSPAFRDLFAPPVTHPACPHCGGKLGTST